MVTSSLANTNGSISHAGTGQFNVSATTLDNTNGKIALNSQNATFVTSSLTNTNGTLTHAGTGQLNISATILNNDQGNISSNGNSTLQLGSDFNNAGVIVSVGNLSLVSTGNISNSAELQAGTTLNVTASNANNAVTGNITGTIVQLHVSSDLTNRGLINAGETQIDAESINNIGTGRIYGDNVSIAAGTLTNDTETVNGTTNAGVIAARNRLDLGISNTLNNQPGALIYSVGDMAIGGGLDVNRRASGLAGTINNNGATIQADGNLSLSSQQINNTNSNFSVATNTTTASMTQYQGNGATTVYNAGDPGVSVSGDNLNTPQGSYSDWTEYNFTRTTATDYVQSSSPGKILSGGNLSINASNVLNDKSQIIAGGTLNVAAGSLQNTQVSGTQTITDSGTSSHHYIASGKGGLFGGGGGPRTDTSSYNPSPTVNSLDLTPTVYQQNASVRGGLIQINQPGQTSSSAGVVTTSLVGRSGAFGFSLPTSSLYKINPAVSASYLVATDPAFTNMKQWLSSDYMIQSIGLDPSVTQKRLGDGFYEQQLVRDQVAQLTGRRFLDGYTSDEQEYQALMNNAVTFAKQYNLQPGIALTAQQMAELTSDIVWLVQQTVTLPDGATQNVLVPQVYIKPQAGDVNGSGALLSGQSVNLNLTGNLSNAGTVAGRQVVQLSADNINNLGGSVSGGNVSVLAQKDINNIGGNISATNNLTAVAGGNLNVVSTTQTTNNSAGDRTTLDRIAGLYVTGANGTLLASAGQDLNVIGGVISNKGTGNTTLNAGNNLTLSTAVTSSNNTVRWDANNVLSQGQSNETGSVVSGAGNVSLSAGQDINARAAQIQAGNTSVLSVSAGNDINVVAGQSTSRLNSAYQYTSSGMLGSKTVSSQQSLSMANAIVSELNGGTVNVSAGNDLVSQGTLFAAANALSVGGGNSQSFYSAQNVQQSSFSQQSTTSLLGFALSKKLVTDDKASSTSIASTLVSTQKIDVNVGSVATFEGAKLSADQINFKQADPTKAGEVVLNGSVDTTQTSHTEKNVTAGVWQKMSGQGSTTQTFNATQLNGKVSFDNGLKISAQIPSGDLKTQIQTLGAQGGLSYLTALANNPNVNWSQIALAHDNWNYSQQGLTGAGAALLAIIIAAYTGGMGLEMLGTTTATEAGGAVTTLGGMTLSTTTAAGATTLTALGTAVNAGFSTLLSQAGVAMVNNGGDIGKTLQQLGSSDSVKSLVTTMVTAGALSSLDEALGFTNNTQTPTGQTGAAAAGTNGIATSQAANSFTQNLLKNITNNVAGAAIGAAINGQSLNESTLANALSRALVTAGMASGANAIGDARQSGDLNAFTQNLAHAILGCAGGAAIAGNGGGCAPGAVGAVVGELAAKYINPTADPSKAGETIAFAKTMSAIAGILVGGGGDNVIAVNVASTTGANAAENNWLSPKGNVLRNIAKAACDNNEASACAVVSTLDKLDQSTKNQLDDLLSACQGGKGDAGACTQAGNIIAARNTIAKQEVDSCPAPYNCVAQYQPSAQENAQAFGPGIPGWGTGATPPTADPVTAAVLIRMGLLSPSAALPSAAGGAIGESMNQYMYGNGTYDLGRIANAAAISWATGGLGSSAKSVYSVAGIGAATSGAATAYNNSQTGSNDSVAASALLGWMFGGWGKVVADGAGDSLNATLNYKPYIPNPSIAAILQRTPGTLVPVHQQNTLPFLVKNWGGALLPSSSGTVETPKAENPQK